MLISVVTIVKQEVAQLRSLIRAIDSQTRPVDELVIVALGRVGVQAEAELASSPVTILHDSPAAYRPGSLASARDDGAEVAVGQLLVFLDADLVPCNQLVARYEEAALRHPEALLAGPVQGGDGEHHRGVHPEVISPGVVELTGPAGGAGIAEELGPADFTGGPAAANIAARREVWRQVSLGGSSQAPSHGTPRRVRPTGVPVRPVPGAVAHRQRGRRGYGASPVTVGAGAMASAGQAVPHPWARR